MAEFCIDCWEKMNETNHGGEEYSVSDYLELCEGCGEYRKVVVARTGVLKMIWDTVKFPFLLIRVRIILWICRARSAPTSQKRDSR